jgi:hypothetical protein
MFLYYIFNIVAFTIIFIIILPADKGLVTCNPLSQTKDEL